MACRSMADGLDNPSIMRRAQVMRRGRVGESNMARDMATESWMNLAKSG